MLVQENTEPSVYNKDLNLTSYSVWFLHVEIQSKNIQQNQARHRDFTENPQIIFFSFLYIGIIAM